MIWSKVSRTCCGVSGAGICENQHSGDSAEDWFEVGEADNGEAGAGNSTRVSEASSRGVESGFAFAWREGNPWTGATWKLKPTGRLPA